MERISGDFTDELCSSSGTAPACGLSAAPSYESGTTSTYSYNANGERTGETVSGPPQIPGAQNPIASLAYGYNVEGQMTSYTGPTGGSPLSIADVGSPGMQGAMPFPQDKLQPTATASYSYDPSGLLSSETATVSAPAWACPPTGHSTQPTRSTSSKNTCTTTSTTSFSWDSSSGMPEMVGVGSYSYVYGPTGTPTEQIGPHGSTLYYLYNRQGSTIALTDSSGHVVARYAYTPYGSLTCGPFTHPNTSPNSPPCHPLPPLSVRLVIV